MVECLRSYILVYQDEWPSLPIVDQILTIRTIKDKSTRFEFPIIYAMNI